MNNEFASLLERILAQSASEQDYEEMLALLAKNPELAEQLSAQLDIDHLLQQNMASGSPQHFVDSVHAKMNEQNADFEFENKVIRQIKHKKNTPWYVTGFSLAATILMAVLFFWPQLPQPNLLVNERTELTYKGVAVVANVVGEQTPFKAGDAIEPGILELKQGFMELEFYHGAQLKIAAPAKLNIINEQRVQLLVGKVMTDVPEVAIGFTIDTPDSEVIDLGTAIGLEVNASGKSQVHVFDGLIEVRNHKGNVQKIKRGHSLDLSTADAVIGTAKTELFEAFSGISDLNGYRANQQKQLWLQHKERILKDKALLAYYEFEKDHNKPRLLKNLAANSQATNGAIVGAQWIEGPWPGKNALEFKRPGDRVRVDIQNKFESFTLATWVKIDSLDRTFNSLLLTDGYNPGEIHWQLGNFNHNQSGTMVLGVHSNLNKARNYNYHPFFTRADSGRWYHLAVSLDQNQRLVKTYINGELVKSQFLKHPSEFYRLGKASIGNWDSGKMNNPLRNLNGSMAELILFSRALSEQEISELALK